jgi:hypothetical protein
MDFYIFYREPVGLLGVFFLLGFFRCNQVSVEFWIYFGTCIFQSLVELDLTHFLGFFHRELLRLRGCHFVGLSSRARVAVKISSVFVTYSRLTRRTPHSYPHLLLPIFPHPSLPLSPLPLSPLPLSPLPLSPLLLPTPILPLSISPPLTIPSLHTPPSCNPSP